MIQIWNDRAEDLWGLRSAEVVGKPLMNLDIGLPIEPLKPAIKACLTGELEPVEVILGATNRRGRLIRRRVTRNPLRNAEKSEKGAILTHVRGRNDLDRGCLGVDGRCAMTPSSSTLNPVEAMRARWLRLRGDLSADRRDDRLDETFEAFGESPASRPTRTDRTLSISTASQAFEPSSRPRS